ncbi:MAG: OadG family protein [Eubacterium sp.]|nr:OadG family protein [Eubacterium sp.]
MATGEITIPIALVHTAIAMGTVFCVLILISFVIWLLKFVPKIINGLSKEKTEAPKKNVQPASAPVAKPQAAPKKTTDGELVAVIAAAIAATMTEETGVPVFADGLVIRSIKKRNFN